MRRGLHTLALSGSSIIVGDDEQLVACSRTGATEQ